MQRKLSEIAEIPKILSSTLATVAQTFDKLMPSDQQQLNASRWAQQPQQQPKLRQKLKQQQMTGRPQRKCSYDEDALDYELRDVAISGAAEDVEAQSGGQPKVKDVTPESDYASEVNDGAEEAAADAVDDDTEDSDVELSEDVDDDELTGSNACDYDEDDDDEDDDEDEDEDETEVGAEAVAAACNYRRNCVSKRVSANRSRGHNVNADTDTGTDTGNDDDDDDDDDIDDNNSASDGTSSAGDMELAAVAQCDNVDAAKGDHDDDNDDDNDFLSTTYTWNLRNIPKLRLNDADNVNDNIVSANAVDGRVAAATKAAAVDNDYADWATAVGDGDGDDSFKPKKKLKRRENDAAIVETADCSARDGDGAPKFMDKLDRAWPWADREKIIYKQSTCHLVRRKPLGLVEQRKQLLAKQNLVDSLQRRERQLQ